MTLAERESEICCQHLDWSGDGYSEEVSFVRAGETGGDYCHRSWVMTDPLSCDQRVGEERCLPVYTQLNDLSGWGGRGYIVPRLWRIPAVG